MYPEKGQHLMDQLDELIEHSDADLILTEDGAYWTSAGLQRLNTKSEEDTAKNNS